MNQERLNKLAEDKAAIEKAVQDVKSGKFPTAGATIPKELCELALEVNQILFGDLDDLRDINPDVKKALYNRELEYHRGTGGLRAGNRLVRHGSSVSR